MLTLPTIVRTRNRNWIAILVTSLATSFTGCSDPESTRAPANGDRPPPGATPEASPVAGPDARSEADAAASGTATGATDATTNEQQPPPAPAGAESGAHNPPPCTLSKWNIAPPAIVQPVARVEDFGAKADGVTDDTAAINAAVQSLTNGGTVMFTAGKKYLRKGKVTVDRANVQLWGYGATILAHYASGTGDAHSTFLLSAPGASIYGLTIISDARRRNQNGNDNAAVWTASDNNRVIDNRVEYGAGMMFRLATHFVAARNVLYRTTADAIHTTTDSLGGHVLCNVVRENGDDMIAVVNYGPKNNTAVAPTVGDVVIEDNDVSGNYWGRGITVIGGKNVVIRNNRISKTVAAALMVEQEGPYHSANVENVTLEKNVIRDVQTAPPAYVPPGFSTAMTGHGAIELAAAYGSVRGLVVKGNDIDHAARNGIRIRYGLVCGAITDNTIANTGAVEIVDNAATVAGCVRTLANNN